MFISRLNNYKNCICLLSVDTYINRLFEQRLAKLIRFTNQNKTHPQVSTFLFGQRQYDLGGNLPILAEESRKQFNKRRIN